LIFQIPIKGTKKVINYGDDGTTNKVIKELEHFPVGINPFPYFISTLYFYPEFV
jgi:hypothetical protein